eukprot:4744040-Alexandrium_andersonii.AAC.1
MPTHQRLGMASVHRSASGCTAHIYFGRPAKFCGGSAAVALLRIPWFSSRRVTRMATHSP